MNPRYQQRLQHARARITRGRRRVDRDAMRLASRVQMAFDWRTIWKKHPVAVVLAAVGAGVAASVMFGRAGDAQHWRRWLSGAAGAGGLWQAWEKIVALVTGAFHPAADQEEQEAASAGDFVEDEEFEDDDFEDENDDSEE